MEGSGTKVGERSEGAAAGSATPGAIAIDGPVAVGKSAVGGLIAERLGYRFVDTGMMYRALAWLALKRRIDLDDGEALGRMGAEASIELSLGSGETPAGRITVDGVDVTDELRSPEVGWAVSLVSRVPRVREAMVALQRQLATRGAIVMAGRDIGTVVLPDAPLKVYLDASQNERARRRHAELRAAGREVALEAVRDDLARRDKIDSERQVSPLRPAEDAIVIETDQLSLEDVVERIIGLVACRS